MVVTDYGSAKEKWEAQNYMVDFKKLNSTTKKYPFPLPFTNEVLNTMVQDVRPFNFGMDIMRTIRYP